MNNTLKDPAKIVQDQIDKLLVPAADINCKTISPEIQSNAEIIWVDINGDDLNDGSEDFPLATLNRARDLIREYHLSGLNSQIVVNIKPGTYRLNKSFELEDQDSGTEKAEVIYRAAEAGTVNISGGIPIYNFEKVTDTAVLSLLTEKSREKVMQCNLKKLGITNYGDILPITERQQPTIHSTIELFCNDMVQPLARWPKDGYITDSDIFPDQADANGNISKIHYNNPRHKKWVNSKHIKLCGYLQNSWLSITYQVENIDTDNNFLTTNRPFLNIEKIKIPEYPNVPADHKIRYYVCNLLEELSEPGDWFLDRDTGILYYYPKQNLEECNLELSYLGAPLVVARNVSYLCFDGIIFELGQQDGMHIINSNNCLVHNCTFRNLAGGAISIESGTDNAIINCHMYSLGRNGCWISGGDRESLTPCNHVLENCHIHHTSRLQNTYSPAARINGVGIRISHNKMHDIPCHVLCIRGNDHIVQFNEIYDSVYDSDDQGGIDAFGNPTFRGNIYRYNYFHNLGTEKSFGVAGIRFDDCISGMMVYGNIFYNTSDGHFGAVQINGGRENIVTHNIIVNCVTGFSGGWTPGWTDNNHMWKTFRAGKSPNWTDYIMSDLYHSRYPLLFCLENNSPMNYIWENSLINVKKALSLNCNTNNTRHNIIGLEKNISENQPTVDDILALPSINEKTISLFAETFIF